MPLSRMKKPTFIKLHIQVLSKHGIEDCVTVRMPKRQRLFKRLFITIPTDVTYQRIIDAGAISFCFTCELRAIIEALDLYETFSILEQAEGLVIFCDSKAALQAILNGGSWITAEIFFLLFRLQELDKVYFFQWLPAHVNITGNENADKLTKEVRILNNDNFVNVTLLTANAVTNFKLREKSISVKRQICNRSGGRFLTKTIARLRRGHHIGMNFDRDSRRTYRNCDNSLDTELTPAHIFDCPATLAALQ
ncbi:RNase H domain-containing protein [Trichonephila clavipes]|nr:RNase H domain-containing protein [Trichonephila clavipes]